MLAVPLTSIVRLKDNPNGYAVYVIEQQGGHSIARLRQVKLGETFGDQKHEKHKQYPTYLQRIYHAYKTPEFKV